MSRRPLALLLAASIPAVAAAHGVSPHVEGVEGAIAARLAALPAEDPAVPALTRAAKALSKPAAEKSFAGEIAGVAKAEAIVLRDAPGETGLLTIISVARDAYRGDLLGARTNVLAAQTAQGLKKRDAKKLAKAGLALETIPDALHDLSKTAEKARGWSAYDSGASYAYVVGSLAVAPAGQGFDLDGDGGADNGIAGLRSTIELVAGSTLEEILADGLAQGVMLLDVFHAGPLQRDKLAFAGLLSGIDSDGDASDNLSGTERFDVDPYDLAADGHAAVRAATSISKGAFRAKIDGAALPVGTGGGLVMLGATISASETTTTASGRIGAAIPTDALLDGLAAAGITIPALLVPTVRAAADLDLDENGSNDAFSIALDFTAVPATFGPAP